MGTPMTSQTAFQGMYSTLARFMHIYESSLEVGKHIATAWLLQMSQHLHGRKDS